MAASVELTFSICCRGNAAVLLEHPAEVVAIRKPTVFRYLLDRLFRVSKEVASSIEAIIEKD